MPWRIFKAGRLEVARSDRDTIAGLMEHAFSIRPQSKPAESRPVHLASPPTKVQYNKALERG